MTAKILLAGFSIVEIPIETDPRTYQEGKKLLGLTASEPLSLLRRIALSHIIGLHWEFSSWLQAFDFTASPIVMVFGQIRLEMHLSDGFPWTGESCRSSVPLVLQDHLLSGRIGIGTVP